jgi:hypothetical protein
VMTEQNGCRTKPFASFRDPLIHAVVGKRQVVFQAAGITGLWRDRRLLVNNQIHLCPPSVRPAHKEPANGDVESNQSAAADALSLRSSLTFSTRPAKQRPTRGVVAALLLNGCARVASDSRIQPALNVSITPILSKPAHPLRVMVRKWDEARYHGCL